ncbi:MAG: hypothetical protein ACQR33_06520 [Candidatus Saccharibacteria bacterium]
MIRTLSARLRTIAPSVVVMLVAWAIYALGFKVLFLPVLFAIAAIYMPMPKILQSWVGRLFGAFFMVMIVLQIAATFQFLLFPSSGFVMAAFWAILAEAALLVIVPKSTPKPHSIISKIDVFAVLVSAFFLLPFTPIFIGHHAMEHIAQIGSTQAIDGPHHYGMIANVGSQQHFTYKTTYYPEGFHFMVAFAENTVINHQDAMSWKSNAILYFALYIVFGMLMAAGLYYLCLRWIQVLTGDDKELSTSVKVTVLLCLAPILAVLYLIPFIFEGFLNYYYVCSTFIVGLLYLSDLKFKGLKNSSSLVIVNDNQQRWNITAYLLLIYGASVSWPLLMPAFVLVGLVFMLPDNLRWRAIVQRWWNWKNLAVLSMLLLQPMPIYFQLKYLRGTTSGQAINYTGTLRDFHSLILLVGLTLVVVILCSRRIGAASKAIFSQIFIPLFLFDGLLVFMQYFTLGEVRYYVLKCLLLLEMLTLILSIGWLLHAYTNKVSKIEAKYVALLAIVPFMAGLLLLGSLANPLRDIRGVFRNYSGDMKPQFIDVDDGLYIKLGEAGKINHFNTAMLHYDKDKGLFFADPQVPVWADTLKYNGSDPDIRGANCLDISLQQILSTSQEDMVGTIKNCITMAHTRQETYYIVTDKISLPSVRAVFGTDVTYIYQ